jgi:NAD(P)H dehydrogenase (quinone)
VGVLVVHAHPEPRSYGSALKDATLAALDAAGVPAETSDLHAMGWKAVADAADFPERADPRVLRVAEEQAHATAAGRLTADVAAEQAKLRRCALLVLHFPLWWHAAPAILKGWFDRVLTPGFSHGPGRSFATGGLRGRRALVCLTAGAAEAAWRTGGAHGPLERALAPLHHGVLAYVGFDVRPPFAVFAPAGRAAAERRAVLAAWRERVRIEAEEAMAYARARADGAARPRSDASDAHPPGPDPGP